VEARRRLYRDNPAETARGRPGFPVERRTVMVRRGIMALALLLSVSVAGADEFTTEHVTVYGTATLQVAPNQMKWRLNVRNTDPASAAAAEAHGARVAAVIAFLKQNQIAEETIQTSHMELGEVWTFVAGSRRPDGYFASTDVSFTLADLSRYVAIWIGLSGLPSVTVQQVDLDHADRIRFQNEARVKAVLAAREKAQGIAEALGVGLGEPLLVDEDLSVNEHAWWARNATMTNAETSAGEPAAAEEYLAPGSIPIRARVKAVFRLLPQR
jgi:uncharacterized protein YggE